MLGSLKIIQTGNIRNLGCGFLFGILYHLRDIASYWSKITKFLYPPQFSVTEKGHPVRISRICLILIKLE